MRSQKEIINMLSDRQLKQQLMLTQLLLFTLAVITSIFLFDSFGDWLSLFHLDWKEIFLYGICTGLVIVLLDILMMSVFPERWYDDGGINKRIFKNRSIPEITYIVTFVAIAEEFLFRGVIQSVFGYFAASILFALIHIRYLTKPVLLISVLFVSFYIGWMFELTSNLLVTVAAHFTVDFLLACLIRYQK